MWRPILPLLIYFLLACLSPVGVSADDVEDARERRDRARAKVTEEYLKIPRGDANDLKALEKKYLNPAERDYAEAVNAKAGGSQRKISPQKSSGDTAVSTESSQPGELPGASESSTGTGASPSGGGGLPGPNNRGLVLDGSGIAPEVHFTSPSSKPQKRDSKSKPPSSSGTGGSRR